MTLKLIAKKHSKRVFCIYFHKPRPARLTEADRETAETCLTAVGASPGYYDLELQAQDDATVDHEICVF